MTNVVKKYAETEKMLFMTIDEAVELSRELAERATQMGIQYDEIVGIANGARLMTTIIADHLSIPYQLLTIRRKGSVIKNYLGKFSFIVRFFSIWYITPVLNYPLIKVMGMMGKLSDDNDQVNKGKFAKKKNILVVDDALEFGSTIQATKQIIKNDNEECQIVVAVISWAILLPNEEQVTSPDIFINRAIQHFPWSMNSPYYQEYQDWLEKHDA